MISSIFCPSLICFTPIILGVLFLLRKHSTVIKQILWAVLFLNFFVMMLSLWTWFDAGHDIGGSHLAMYEYEDDTGLLLEELFLRLYLPPPLRQRCYFEVEQVCREVDSILGFSYGRERFGWRRYGISIGITLVSSIVLTFIFTGISLPKFRKTQTQDISTHS